MRHNEKCQALVTYLLSKGAEMNVKNIHGKTVLDLTIDLHNSTVLEYFINSNKKDFDTESIENSLMMASVNGIFLNK